MTDFDYQWLGVGWRVWFAEEKRPYVVQAVSPDRRWVICTKPFAAQRTVLYTVLDRVLKVRGVDNMIFTLGYETREECEEAVALFHAGEAEHSHRHKPIPLVITKIQDGTTT